MSQEGAILKVFMGKLVHILENPHPLGISTMPKNYTGEKRGPKTNNYAKKRDKKKNQKRASF